MKLVLTSAAGRLGSHLREPLSKLSDSLIPSEFAEVSNARAVVILLNTRLL